MLRGKTPLAVALALGLTAGVIAYSAIQRAGAEARRGWNPVPVLVAAVDLSEGAVLTSETVAVRSVPDQFVTGSVVKPDSATFVVGQRVLVPLQAGDPLLWSQFETTRASERLSSKVLRRGRAITIDAKATTAVGGWVRPNDRVDVLGSFKDPDTGKQTAVTLLQNVTVVATGKITGTTNLNLLAESQRDYSNVSLLVIPEEAELLVLAQELGALTLTLRNEEDATTMDERGHTTIATLFSHERQKLWQEKRMREIEVIRGARSERSRVEGSADGGSGW